MGNAFWESWALWAKMCFVLGCAIVLTILLGCLKLLYTRYRLRKYTAIADKRQAQLRDREQGGEVMQQKVNDVPFGIRAIQSGIQVDGVWISGSNTPVPSTPISVAASSIDEPSPPRDNRQSAQVSSSSSNIPRVEIPQPVRPQFRTSPGKRNPPLGVHGYEPNRGSFAGRMSGRPDSPTTEPGFGSRQTYQPRHSSHLRYSSPNLLRHSSTLDALEGHARNVSGSTRASGGSEEERRTNRSSDSSNESGNSQGHYIPKRPGHVRFQTSMSSPSEAVHLTPIDSLPFTEGGRGELESLTNHRLSHAAETGQLLPRVRPTGLSGDWTTSSRLPSQPQDTREYVRSYRPRSANESRDPFATPRVSVAPDEVIYEPPSFQEFVENTPTTVQQLYPLLQAAELRDGHEQRQVLQAADTNQLLQPSRVVRKVNSGFEVLPSGTFDAQRQSRELPEQRNQISEHGDKRQSHRLQKKRRDSSSA